ncbi:lysine N(6)-hydroxylase/L-ornithine N(5)-oxygenase family protein [Bradyrhizobium prioriisuperbiae]|uniref:lysine N(6)-hydroxylase/L-ornithine N(5)-oxygenase family protein n=1 Tax=Bradyrhizobium prioriisuperbiae TaxID=2854389 RepID=UPI0028ED816F|nr:SidA/IucD/PvdA family monooxygenase [Bradyrhizobium prioritasuperba]
MAAATAGIYDVIGIGIGPFNLSTAALLDGVPHLASAFFERKSAFTWHPGLLFRDALLQTSFLKDLVSFADPTSRHSFINFLHSHRRLHQFINADFDRITRAEFTEYMSWVASRLPNLHFGQGVEQLTHRDGLFVARIEPNLEVLCKHVVVGIGRRDRIPACARQHLGASVFHAGRFLERIANVPPPRTVTVVGGGQSAAEIFLHFVRSNGSGAPVNINWVTRRYNFSPLDETPFTNEYFTPLYAEYFHGMDLGSRRDALATQKLASDGISSSTLREIYQEIYRAKYLERRNVNLRLLVDQELTDLQRVGAESQLTFSDTKTGAPTSLTSDLVVLATGYEAFIPPFLENIAHMFEIEDGYLRLRRDFSAQWRMPCSNRLYLQNAAQQTHGVADPNLSLMAWRSATIINSLLGYEHFQTPQSDQFIERTLSLISQQQVKQAL